MRVIDTTVAVDHLRGHKPATALLESFVGDGETLAASEIVRFELLAGVRETEIVQLERFFAVISWVPVSERVTRTAGELARRFRGAFSGIDDADYLIAATALLLDAHLLTTNVRHFPMVPDLAVAY